jgi:hypothetical protein
MELKEFLKKYLPDYKAKIEDAKGGIELDEQVGLYMHWQNKVFSEALQNFTDIILYKQRKYCAEYYQANEPYEHQENWFYNGISECEQPEIEEL